MMDFPALILASSVAQVPNAVLGSGVMSASFSIIVTVVFITIQWLMAGAVITFAFNEYRLSESIKNELGLKLD